MLRGSLARLFKERSLHVLLDRIICRPAVRNGNEPSNRNHNLGFRLSSADHRPMGIVEGWRPFASGLSSPVVPAPEIVGQ